MSNTLPQNLTQDDIAAFVQAAVTAAVDQATLAAKAEKDRQAAQARINGSKSKGPVTPEGKAKVSRNAIKHGYAAQKNSILAIEDSEAWQAHLTGYRATYKPANYGEADIVDELASISFRKARLVAIETSLIDFQLTIQEENVDKFFPQDAGDYNLHLALAWQGLSRKPLARLLPPDPSQPYDPFLPPEELDLQSIELVRRYLTTLDRQFRSALLNLQQLRKHFREEAAPAPAAVVTVDTTVVAEAAQSVKEEATAAETAGDRKPKTAVAHPPTNPNKPGKLALVTPQGTVTPTDPPSQNAPNASEVAA